MGFTTMNIICFIFDILIIIYTIGIIIIYAKTKTFHSYPCYFNIFFSSIIALTNITRLITLKDFKEGDIICTIQAFSMALLDKLMLTTMTVHSSTSFLGIVTLEFYKQNEKCIFISSIIISILISLTLAIFFILNGTQKYDDVCYVRSKPGNGHEIIINKELIDIIATSILFAINVFCIIYLLIFIFKTMKEYKKSKNKNLGNMSFHFCKFSINFILNDITFIMVILIIADIFDGDYVGLSYVILSFLIIIFYTINQPILREIKKTVCCIKDDDIPTLNYDEVDENDDNGLEIGNIEEGMLSENK
jgi:hypothetical protein